MDVSELTRLIHDAADSPGNIKDEERSRLLEACGKLNARLESAREAALRVVFAVRRPNQNAHQRHPIRQ